MKNKEELKFGFFKPLDCPSIYSGKGRGKETEYHAEKMVTPKKGLIDLLQQKDCFRRGALKVVRFVLTTGNKLVFAPEGGPNGDTIPGHSHLAFEAHKAHRMKRKFNNTISAEDQRITEEIKKIIVEEEPEVDIESCVIHTVNGKVEVWGKITVRKTCARIENRIEELEGIVSLDSYLGTENFKYIFSRCITAGNAFFTEDNTLVRIDNKSGDFRPDFDSLQFVLPYFYSLPDPIKIQDPLEVEDSIMQRTYRVSHSSVFPSKFEEKEEKPFPKDDHSEALKSLKEKLVTLDIRDEEIREVVESTHSVINDLTNLGANNGVLAELTKGLHNALVNKDKEKSAQELKVLAKKAEEQATKAPQNSALLWLVLSVGLMVLGSLLITAGIACAVTGVGVSLSIGLSAAGALAAGAGIGFFKSIQENVQQFEEEKSTDLSNGPNLNPW